MTACTNTKPDTRALSRLRDEIDAVCAEMDKTGRNCLTTEEHDLWRRTERTCIAAGVCFRCYVDYDEDGKRGRVQLGLQEAGNYYENAGRECPQCGEFYTCGEQPEYETAGCEWRGDADSGL